MPTKEQIEAIKKAQLQQTGLRDDKFEGYHFQEDSIANQMAFLFGGDKRGEGC